MGYQWHQTTTRRFSTRLWDLQGDTGEMRSRLVSGIWPVPVGGEQHAREVVAILGQLELPMRRLQRCVSAHLDEAA